MLLMFVITAFFGLIASVPTYLLLRGTGGTLRATVAFIAGFAAGIAAIFALCPLLDPSIVDGFQIPYHGAQGSVIGPLLAILAASRRRKSATPSPHPSASR